MEDIFIIGSSGHAKVVIDIVEKEHKYKIVGLLDDYRTVGEKTFEYSIVGKIKDLPQLCSHFSINKGVIAIGANFVRYQIAKEIINIYPAFQFITAIHPSVSIARDVSIGEGAVISAGVIINTSCSIGKCCILNTRASLDHDSTMGDFSSLAPNVATGGAVSIGACAAIGIGATIIHGVNVGEHTVIGAGATVLNDIGSYKVAYGTPARVVRDRQPNDVYL